MEIISWKNGLMTEEVLQRVGEKRRALDVIRGMTRNWMGHCMRQTQGNMRVETLEGLGNAKRNGSRWRDQTTDDIKVLYQTVSWLSLIHI